MNGFTLAFMLVGIITISAIGGIIVGPFIFYAMEVGAHLLVLLLSRMAKRPVLVRFPGLSDTNRRIYMRYANTAAGVILEPMPRHQRPRRSLPVTLVKVISFYRDFYKREAT